MCVVAFHLDRASDYPFIFVGNRDELYTREAKQIHQWEDYPSIVGGRDLEQGGTWLGISQDGSFSTILNHPMPGWASLDETISRGKIVSDYLIHRPPTHLYVESLRNRRKEYQGYYQLFGNIRQLHCYSNINDTHQTFTHGIYSFSNTQDDLSNYRLALSKQALEDLKVSGKRPDPEKLIDAFANQDKHPNFVTYPPHLDYQRAYNSSSLFIQDEVFGTVSTTAIIIDKFGHVDMVERRFSPKGFKEQSYLKFKINHSEVTHGSQI